MNAQFKKRSELIVAMASLLAKYSKGGHKFGFVDCDLCQVIRPALDSRRDMATCADCPWVVLEGRVCTARAPHVRVIELAEWITTYANGVDAVEEPKKPKEPEFVPCVLEINTRIEFDVIYALLNRNEGFDDYVAGLAPNRQPLRGWRSDQFEAKSTLFARMCRATASLGITKN